MSYDPESDRSACKIAEEMRKYLMWDPRAPFEARSREVPKCEPQYSSETEKPIGTRDPDKFLKEQQDRLWKEMM